MATLKENVNTIATGVKKNLAVVWPQAQERLRVASVQAIRNRKTDSFESLASYAEECDAVVKWLEKLSRVVQECPEIREVKEVSQDEQPPTLPKQERHAPVEIEE